MLGDIKSHNLPAMMGQNDHHIEQPKRCTSHDKHVDGGDTLGLVAQKAPPSRRGPASSSRHVLGDRRLADLDAELEQLAVDPRRTPEWVGAAHLPNQITNLALD